MTTAVDWATRAVILHGTAMRLDSNADSLKDEAVRLRRMASECKAEAERLQSSFRATE